MGNYRIVFTDLDGTILKKDKTITERTSKALTGLKDKNILWAVATARPEVAITFYDEIKHADALITLNGAKIRLGDKVISNGLDKDDALMILKTLMEKDDLVISVETSKGIFGNIEIPEWETPKIGDLVELIKTVDVYKILVAGREHDLQTIADSRDRFCTTSETEKRVDDAIAPFDSVYCSVAEGWLFQIMSRNATKWKGIELVLQTEGIDAKDAVYFGDDNDDTDSIRNCGLGVAMGNAIDRVKDAADIIAPSNEEDGVAFIIEERL